MVRQPTALFIQSLFSEGIDDALSRARCQVSWQGLPNLAHQIRARLKNLHELENPLVVVDRDTTKVIASYEDIARVAADLRGAGAGIHPSSGGDRFASQFLQAFECEIGPLAARVVLAIGNRSNPHADAARLTQELAFFPPAQVTGDSLSGYEMSITLPQFRQLQEEAKKIKAADAEAAEKKVLFEGTVASERGEVPWTSNGQVIRPDVARWNR